MDGQDVLKLTAKYSYKPKCNHTYVVTHSQCISAPLNLATFASHSELTIIILIWNL